MPDKSYAAEMYDRLPCVCGHTVSKHADHGPDFPHPCTVEGCVCFNLMFAPARQLTTEYIGELTQAIHRQRASRNWTNQQWKDEFGDQWPQAVARTQREHDEAVDKLHEIAHNLARV